jgi:hypothetical protein
MKAWMGFSRPGGFEELEDNVPSWPKDLEGKKEKYYS